MKNKKDRANRRQEKLLKKKRSQWKWTILITIWTLILSLSIGLLSEILLTNIQLFSAFLLLLVIILIGVIFDIIGIAVTAADQTPFHSMAANKVYGSKQAVQLVKNAGQVSNFCNDVIGDICGIISGSTAAIIIFRMATLNILLDTKILGAILSGLVAALTVGGKAIGKNFAITKSNEITYGLAITIHWMKTVVGKEIK